METVRLYSFLPANFGLKVLQSGRVKLARTSKLNDPFDCHFRVTSDLEEDRPKCDEMERAVANFRDDNYSLLCLSATWREPLMWSHYARNHTGVAIVFELEKNDSLLPVKYRTERPHGHINNYRGSATQKIKHAAFESVTTKSLSWDYEEEFRFLIGPDQWKLDGGRRLYELPDDSIVGVILGMRCRRRPAVFREKASAAVRKDFEVWKAVESVTEFKLNLVEA